MGKKQKTDLTADEITVWAEQLAGSTVQDIAARHSVSTRTVFNWLENAKKQIGDVDLEGMRRCLFSLFDKAFKAVDAGLTHGDPKDRASVGLRLFSGLSVLTDKKDGDTNVNVVVNNEGKEQLQNNRRAALDKLRYSPADDN